MVERQRIEADHTIGRSTTDGSKQVPLIENIFAMLDEICHAPYHCYFCHKRRTANQAEKESWNKPDRDYTNG